MFSFKMLNIILLICSFLVLGVASYTDIKSRRIPNKLSIIMLLLSIINVTANIIAGDVKHTLVSTAIGGLLSLILVGIPYIANKSLGAGDLKLSVAAGLFFGYKNTLSMLFIAFFICAIFSVILFVMNKKGRNFKLDSIPFAPFLLTGALYAIITRFIL